ncbi:MAG TPA: hypothetical protein ENN09_07545 [Planctomycetes bacterium]|nr:hypothetical protein [Planctomycetota bacterium]
MSDVFEILPGRLYGAARPGWSAARESDFLARIKTFNVACVVSLQETPPRPELARKLADRDVKYVHVPVADFHAPGEGDVAVVRGCYRDAVKRGRALLLHCTAGVGRTGTMAAALLVAEAGMNSREAIGRVRSVRPGAIETREQERFVLRFAEKLARKNYGKKRRRRGGSKS